MMTESLQWKKNFTGSPKMMPGHLFPILRIKALFEQDEYSKIS